MDDFDDLLKSLLKSTSNQASEGTPDAENADCLSEEFLAAYLDGLLIGVDKDRVEAHLSDCKECRAQGVVLNELRTELGMENIQKAPRRVTESAKQLVQRDTLGDLVEIIVEFTRDSLRLLWPSGSSPSFSLQPVPLRSASYSPMGRTGKEAVIRVRQEFEKVIAQLTLEKVDESECEITAQITDIMATEPLDKIRVSLIRNKRELASYLTEEGRVSFSNLTAGVYTLEMTRQKDLLGKLLIRLEAV